MKEITENNILLAEFLGWETNSIETIAPEEFRTIIPFKTTNGNEYFTTTIFKNEDLKFHNDWNWLMPVLQKCDAVAYELGVHEDWIEKFQTSLSQYEIRDVYDVCVEFVKFYNDNKIKKDMNTYRYFLPTTAIRASFGHGIVKANNGQEALEKAKEKLKYDFDKVNEVLASADVTLGFELEFDVNTVEVELL